MVDDAGPGGLQVLVWLLGLAMYLGNYIISSRNCRSPHHWSEKKNYELQTASDSRKGYRDHIY